MTAIVFATMLGIIEASPSRLLVLREDEAVAEVGPGLALERPRRADERQLEQPRAALGLVDRVRVWRAELGAAGDRRQDVADAVIRSRRGAKVLEGADRLRG